jgi:hypothetical protein
LEGARHILRQKKFQKGADRQVMPQWQEFLNSSKSGLPRFGRLCRPDPVRGGLP